MDNAGQGNCSRGGNCCGCDLEASSDVNCGDLLVFAFAFGRMGCNGLVSCPGNLDTEND